MHQYWPYLPRCLLLDSEIVATLSSASSSGHYGSGDNSADGLSRDGDIPNTATVVSRMAVNMQVQMPQHIPRDLMTNMAAAVAL